MTETFGRYELLERLGAGGMAEVFRARLGVPAAGEKILVIKRLLPSAASDPEALQLFVEEARLALALTHGNITTAYEFGEVDGRYFLALEYIRGPDLASVLARCRSRARAMPVEAALYVAVEVAKGLAYAHAFTDPRGGRVELVHRDVSPDNILLSYDGTAKLTDFGIARLKAAPAGGVLRGKPGYLAPELADGRPADGRADVFALGCVLHEMLTMRRPFAGEGPAEILSAIRAAERPPLAELRREVGELEPILGRALAAEPAARFGSATELQVALAAVLFQRAPAYGGRELAAWLRELYAWELREESDPVLRASIAATGDRAPDAKTLELAKLPVQDGVAPLPETPARRHAPRPLHLALMAGAALSAVVAGRVAIDPPGPTARARPELDGGAAAAGGSGRLSVSSWPSANVTIDGQALPKPTPILDLQLPAGRHRIGLERPDLGLRKEIWVDLPPGGERTVAVTLDR